MGIIVMKIYKLWCLEHYVVFSYYVNALCVFNVWYLNLVFEILFNSMQRHWGVQNVCSDYFFIDLINVYRAPLVLLDEAKEKSNPI
jgi:hypothetical protein